MTGGEHIPQIHKETYIDSVGDYFFAYNPLSQKGVIILTDELLFLYKTVDNRRNLAKVYEMVLEKLPYLTQKRFAYLVEILTRAELIYFGKPALLERIYTYKSKTFAVWFHITNQCNLRCTYCFVGKTNEQMDDELVEKSMRSLFESASKNKYETLFIQFAGGEPLLQLNRVIKGAELANELGKKYGITTDLEIITNGVLLTQKAVELLEKHNVKISVSIDGVDQSHDKNRPFVGGGSSLQRVLTGLSNAKGSKIFKNVIVTITRHNVKKIPSMVEFFLKNNIEFFLQFFTDNSQMNPKIAKELKVNDDELIHYLRKAYKLVHRYMPKYKFMNGLIHTARFDKPVAGCPASNHIYMTIKQDGQLANCNWMLEKPVGSVHDKGDLIGNFKKNSYIKPITAFKRKIKCFTCRWQYVCSGCPLDFYWDETSTEPPYCKTKMALIPEVLKLEAERIIRYSLGHNT